MARSSSLWTCLRLSFILALLGQPVDEADSPVDSVDSASYFDEFSDVGLSDSFFAEEDLSLPAPSDIFANGTNQRRLVGQKITGSLPSVTALKVMLGPTGRWCKIPGCAVVGDIYAGMRINSIELGIGHLGDYFARHPTGNGRLRVVRSTMGSYPGAQTGGCAQSFPGALRDAVVSSPWSGLGSLVTYLGGAPGKNKPETVHATSPMTFLMGGLYKICYSDDGTFSSNHGDIARQNILVQGVYDSTLSCTEVDNNCLTFRKHYCYVLKNAYNHPNNIYYNHKPGQRESEYGVFTSCVIDLSYSGVGIEGSAGEGSWSAPFSVTYEVANIATTQDESPVKVKAVIPQKCSTTPAYFLCPNGGNCDSGDNEVALTSATKRRVPLPVARNDLGFGNRFKAYEVAACYCPGYDGCNARTDFLQQIGILYYFATKICGYGDDGFKCSTDYTGTASPFRFSLRVDCPGDACTYDGINRIKIVAKNVKNDLPSWDSNNGCFAAVHGLSTTGDMFLPADVNLDVSDMDGGPREDFKLWNYPPSNVNLTTTVTYTSTSTTSTSTFTTTTINGTNITYTSTTTSTTTTTTLLDVKNLTTGFIVHKGFNFHERIGYDFDESFDVCFCNDACHVQSAWFKVGEMRSTPIQLVSAASNVTTEASLLALLYVNQPAILGFYRPPNASNQLGMEDGGMVKLVEDRDLNLDDVGCRNAIYSSNVSNTTTGLSTGSAPTVYRGTTSSADPFKLIFNGGNLNNKIKVQKAGFIGICYCPKTDGRYCYRNNWVLAARLTIKGPNPGQNWLFSTHMVFRLGFTGYGLSKDDKIRIIDSSKRCSDDDSNPNGETRLTGLRMQCPHPCVAIGSANQPINGDFSINTLADDRVGCDRLNSNCVSLDIKQITVLDSKRTEIRWEREPGFSEGDLITLGDNIICDPNGPTCTSEMLATLKGLYKFADRNDNTPVAPDTYAVGQAVHATAIKQSWVIDVGWPEPAPKFLVVTDVNNNYKRGRWERHSKGITREEILGRKEGFDMKVCWKYGGAQSSYVGQIGTMTLKEPSPMANCLISMSSTIKRAASPIILSWRTSSPKVAPRYTNVRGATQMRILWTNILAMDAYYVTNLPMKPDSGADELKDAKQFVCGTIFKEMWSSDSEFGFPVPQGCYHRAFGNAREIFIVFDAKNGLKPSQDYQVVMFAKTQEGVQQYEKYAEIMVMDDTVLRPFEAIERGIATLRTLPQSRAAGTKGVMFLEPNGFKVVRGDAQGLYEMSKGKSLFFEIRGEPMGGGIRASSILRIFLWPLTQWNVDQQCAATCIPYDDKTACGAMRACTGEAIVPGFHRNVLRLKLPVDMITAQATLYHTVKIDNLRMPPGGIFPLYFPAQISKSDDTKPHYVLGGGSLLFKVPNDGQTYARLVDVYGDGDSSPFRGDSENVLYAHIVLGATLFAEGYDDARMTITLPEGYECLRLQDFEESDHEGKTIKVNPWKAEDNLKVFGTTIPQGRGTIDEGSGKRGWSVYKNSCTFTLGQMSVVYAYASMFFRITVNNPDMSMKREDAINQWSVSIQAKGLHLNFLKFPPVAFKSSVANFAANSAVLGRMDSANIVPWHFAHSMSAKPSEVYIFFATEQLNNVLGFVRVVSPSGFKFDNGPNCQVCHTGVRCSCACVARDLPDSSYYTLRRPGMDTYRLPGIVSCTYQTHTDFVPYLPFNRAEIKLEGSLRAKSWYGFRLGVRNIVPYSAGHQDQWRLFTLTENNFRVDGTPLPVLLSKSPQSLVRSSPVANKSFGVYRFQLKEVAVLLSTLRAYTLTGLRSLITVRPLMLPFKINTTLRVIAPAGFMWDFSGGEFWNSAGLGQGGYLSCITASMPGGLPQKSGNFLFWNKKALYKSSEIYGFAAFARVPQQSPSSSVNAFIIQFGFESNISSNRIAASTAPPQYDPGASNIDLVPAPKYDPSISLIRADTHLILQFITPPGDGLVPGAIITIQGPAPNYFSTYGDCTKLLQTTTLAAGCANASKWPKMLPKDITCNATKSNANGLHIELVVGPSRLLAGLYRFQLSINDTFPAFGQATTAPRRLASSVRANLLKLSSPCSLERCWKTKTVLKTGQLVIPWTVFKGPLSDLAKQQSGTEVAALSDGRVDYAINVVGARNNLTFTIRTVTNIRKDGGFRIIGPEGFEIPSTCTVEQPGGIRGNPYYVWSTKNTRDMLPRDIACTSFTTQGYTPIGAAYVPGTTVIDLRAGASGLSPRLYRFQIKVRNPLDYRPNPKSLDPLDLCGFKLCWLFKSIDNLAQKPFVQLDFPISVTSFWVNRALLEAKMPEVSWAQRGSSGRDDRPLHSNPVIFAFKLHRAAVYPGYFKVRAPLGYVFREECLPDVVTNGSKVFGTTLPAEYTAWDPDARVTSCRGDGPNLQFWVDPGVSPGLRKGKLFAFRLTLLYNAPSAPVDNRWTMDYAMESCLPFEGFKLWTFLRTSKHGVSWARISPLMGSRWLNNAVTFTFRPYVTVGGKGAKIRITAPPYYMMVHSRGECKMSVQELQIADADKIGTEAPPFNFTDISSLLSPAYVRWGESEIYCNVDPKSDLRNLVGEVKVGHRQLVSGRDYQLTIFVNNPRFFPPWQPRGLGKDQAASYPWTLTPSMWVIQTEAPPEAPVPRFRDISTIPHSDIIPNLAAWSVVNYNPITELPDLIGKAKVANVRFSLSLSHEPQITEKLKHSDHLLPWAALKTARPQNVKAWIVLGWVKESWDAKNTLKDPAKKERLKPMSERKQWAQLTSLEKKAATFLRYTMNFWDTHEGDYVWIEAPAGFNLTADPTEPSWEEAISATPTEMDVEWASCNNFRWSFVSQEYISRTRVMCRGRRMMIIFSKVENISNLIVPNKSIPLSFRMDLVNAPKTPHVSINHWTARHQTSENITRSEDAFLGWSLQSQLEDVMVNLTGKNKAEQATSTLELYFTPVSDAGELFLEAMLPVRGWNFASAEAVSLGHEVVPEVRKSILDLRRVRVRCTLYAGLPVIIQLAGVGLGYWGGITSFNLKTKLTNGVPKDERYGFKTGFRLPGRVSVIQKTLKNRFQQDPVKYPAPSLWSSRMTEDAVATFIFTLTQSAKKGTALRIRAPPYWLHRATLTNASVESLGNGEVVLRLNKTLESWDFKTSGYMQYVCKVYVITPAVAKPKDSMWHFDFVDSDMLAVNTNDGLTQGFPLVSPIGFSVYAARSPPMAEILVSLTVDPKGRAPTELVIVAPRNYNFTQNCLEKGGKGGEIIGCVRKDLEGDIWTAGVWRKVVWRRAAAVLAARNPGLMAPITEGLIIKVLCPSRPQEETSWFLQARNSIFNTELGWGEAVQGITVKPMPYYGVVYSGVGAPVLNRMIFYFKSTFRVGPGGKLRVHFPTKMGVYCNKDQTKGKLDLPANLGGKWLEPMSLVGEVECEVNKKLAIGDISTYFFEISLPSAMDPGWQAFSVTFSLYSKDYLILNRVPPSANNFSILAFEPPHIGGNVVDAAMAVPGMRPSPVLMAPVKALGFQFGSSKANTRSRVSLGFSTPSNFPLIHDENNTGPVISSILFRVPSGFFHLIKEWGQVQLTTAVTMPFNGTEPDHSFEHHEPNWFRFFLREKGYNAKVPQLGVGEYRFTFPVMIPAVIPVKNIWMLTLCGVAEGKYENTTCDDEYSPLALTTIPWPGFTMGQASTGIVGIAAGAIRSFGFQGCWAVFALICAHLLVP